MRNPDPWLPDKAGGKQTLWPQQALPGHVVSEGPLWEQTPVFSCEGRGRGLSGVSFTRALIPFM